MIYHVPDLDQHPHGESWLFSSAESLVKDLEV